MVEYVRPRDPWLFQKVKASLNYENVFFSTGLKQLNQFLRATLTRKKYERQIGK